MPTQTSKDQLKGEVLAARTGSATRRVKVGGRRGRRARGGGPAAGLGLKLQASFKGLGLVRTVTVVGEAVQELAGGFSDADTVFKDELSTETDGWQA